MAFILPPRISEAPLPKRIWSNYCSIKWWKVLTHAQLIRFPLDLGFLHRALFANIKLIYYRSIMEINWPDQPAIGQQV